MHYACVENQEAYEYLESALGSLRKRTDKRNARGVEGTSEV